MIFIITTQTHQFITNLSIAPDLDTPSLVSLEKISWGFAHRMSKHFRNLHHSIENLQFRTSSRRTNFYGDSMAETTPETRQFKDSPFSIKNLLNCESKPALIKPKAIMNSTKGLVEHSLSLSRVGELSFPRFDLPVHRFGLAAQWWYPYSPLHRTGENPSENKRYII